MKREINDLNKPHILGGGQKRRRLKKSAIVLIVCALLIIISVTVGLILYQPFNIRIKKAEYHLLVLHKTPLEAEAASYALAAASAGGAGQILNDGDFLVAAFVYKNKSDASKVQERMKGNYPDAQIKTMTFSKKKIKRFGDRGSEKVLEGMIKYPFKIIDRVVDMVYGLDSFEKTESGVLLEVEQLKKEILHQSDILGNLKKKHPSLTAATVLSTFFDNIYSDLSKESGPENQEQRLTGRLKKFTCRAVWDYQSIYRDISGK